MSDLSKETRNLLARGRGGTGMPTRRRTAIKGAVLAKAAAGTVVTTSVTAAAWTTTTKAIGMAAVALAVGGGTVGVVRYENAKAERENAATVTTRTNAVATTSKPPSAEPLSTVETMTEPIPIPVALTPEPELTNAARVRVIDGTTATTTTATTTATTATTSTTSTTAASSSLGEETALLRRAHDAIASGDAPQALSLLEQHARRFPTSALEPERSAERVFAYCAEHETDAARGAATSFLTSHPTGPLSDRVRSSCGGTK